MIRWQHFQNIYVVGTAIFSMCVVAGVAFLFSEAEYSRFQDPSGYYEVVVTTPTYEMFIPRMPGDGSSKAGTIRIYDTQGHFYGARSVSMVWMAQDIRWQENEAYLIGVGEWKLDSAEKVQDSSPKGTCQSRQS